MLLQQGGGEEVRWKIWASVDWPLAARQWTRAHNSSSDPMLTKMASMLGGYPAPTLLRQTQLAATLADCTIGLSRTTTTCCLLGESVLLILVLTSYAGGCNGEQKDSRRYADCP